MEPWELINISSRYMALENPISREKIIAFGECLRLHEGSRVIDFGCGYGEALVLWAEHFGVTGVGIDARSFAVAQAIRKVVEHGLTDRIEIVCARGEEYEVEPGQFDAATCIGATFIWDGYERTIRALSRATRPGGRIGIGEEYWLTERVSPHYAQHMAPTYTEYELLQLTRSEGYDVEHIIRSSHDDWDRYEAGRWHGLIRWLEENHDHPEHALVVERLHAMQDDYLQHGRASLGWALYALAPKAY